MTRHHTLTALAVCAAIAAGCGDDDPDDGGAAKPETQKVSLAERHAQLEKDPHGLRCADIEDKVASADISRRVQYALADDAKIRGLTRLQVLAEHLLRDHRALQGKARLLRARRGRHRGRPERGDARGPRRTLR